MVYNIIIICLNSVRKCRHYVSVRLLLKSRQTLFHVTIINIELSCPSVFSRFRNPAARKFKEQEESAEGRHFMSI